MAAITFQDGSAFWHTMGRRFRVLAVFTTDREANAYMEAHPGASVIGVAGPFVVLADKDDRGVVAD